MNGAVEVANKNIKKIVVKMIDTYKDWYKFLPFASCNYYTSIHASTCNSYSLIYGMEVFHPVEVEIPSLEMLSQTVLSEVKWACSQYKQLNMIDEKHMTIMCHGKLYQHCIERAFNKKVRPKVFEEGDLVLKKSNQAMPDYRRKFAPTYEGLYVVKKAFSGGALILIDMDRNNHNMPTNSNAVI